MSTITKEQLRERAREKVKSLEFSITQTAFADSRAELEEELEMARIALASLELERGMIRRFDLDMSDCDSCGQDCGADMVEDLDGEYVLWDEVLPHLYRYDEYTTPPAPVSVPDEHNSVIAEQLAHVLSGMEVTEHQRAVIICAVDRLNHNAEMLQKAPAAPAAQEAILYEPSPTDSVNAPLKFTDVEDRAWVVGAEWMRDAFKSENPHLRIANDDDPAPQSPRPAPVSVPDDVMAAMQKVARIRLDLNDFDGDKRGILDCLGDAEEALIEVVNSRAAMLQGE